MNKKRFDTMGSILFIFAGVVIGVGIMLVYQLSTNKSNDCVCPTLKREGCWTKIRSGESQGDWVCVNVESMSYQRALEVCAHEVGHELWAEICEKDDELCRKAQKMLDNYSKEE